MSFGLTGTLAALVAISFVGLSFFGWGGLVHAALRVELARPLRLVTGLCAYLAFGSLLETFGAACAAALVGFNVIGAILASPSLWRWARRERVARHGLSGRTSSRSASPLWALGCLFALFLLNSAVWYFNIIDDVHGYLVLAKKVLAEGTESNDPFLYRRTESGVGASAYVTAMAQTYLGFAGSRAMDIGLGSAILALLFVANLRDAVIVRPGQVFFAAAYIFLFLCAAPNINLSPDFTALAVAYGLFTLMFIEIDRRGRPIPVGVAALIGLYVASLIALKTTYLVPAASLAAAGYLALFSKTWKASWLARAGLSLAVMAALLAPWMLPTYRVGGTLLFPFLGSGYLSKDEFGVPQLAQILVQERRIILALVFPLSAAALLWFSPLRWGAAVLAGLSTFLTVAAAATVSVFAFRYLFVQAALLNAALATLLCRQGVAWPRVSLVLPGVAAAAFALLAGMSSALQPWPTLSRGWIATAVTDNLGIRVGNGVEQEIYPDMTRRRDEFRASIEALQGVTQPGAGILAILDTPYFLDFRRNRVFVMDWPGSASPGGEPVPSDSSPERWRAYLASKGIRYVLLAANPGWLAPDGARVELKDAPRWHASLWGKLYIVMDAMNGLRSACSVVLKQPSRVTLDCGSGVNAVRRPE